MAEVSDAGNNSSEQETEAGRSAGMERSTAPCPASEPLLLGDTPPGAEPPAHVRRLLAWIRDDAPAAEVEAAAAAAVDGDTAKKGSAMDALVGLLFVLAVETGFTPLAAEDRLRVAAPAHCGPSVPSLRAISRMPRAWRQRRPAGPHYLVDFALGTTAADAEAEAPEASEAAVRLAGVVCGGVLIANMLTADATFSIGLVAEDYVGRGGALHKLGPLSRAFKDAVAVPARAAVLNARCVCNASLLGLPVDLQLLLARTLAAGELRDLLHLGLTCRCLAAVLDDPVTWRLVARRHHPTLYKQLEGQEQVDWKDRVRREREKLASAARRQRRRSPPPTPPPPPQPPPPPFRPFLPFPPPRPMPRPWYPDDDDLFL